MRFEPTKRDYKLSPYTGLTRDSFLEAAHYVLDGIFRNIRDFEDPVIVPRAETVITYPHANSPKGFYEAEKRAEAFEGLTRSFFFGSVLLCNEPEAVAGGYVLRDYYKNQILRSCTPGDKLYVGDYETLYAMAETDDPVRPFQQTVETCALVIGLWACEEVIWKTYTKEEQDVIAAFLSSFAKAPTVPQNWRLFNMLDMAFLAGHGYPIDREIMYEHATQILHYYAGDGWYRDGQCFDYYSCWAFQVYGPLWCQWYGYEHMPELAAAFERNSRELMKTYPCFFDADGHTMMWGRSCIYRNASTSAFDGNCFLREPSVNYGWARRITAGSLLQFFEREDTFVNGVPSLGFYGQFSPLVQGYSCAESPLWMGKAFLCLHFPADHPFWTETENNGIWEELSENAPHTTHLPGPALTFTNHKKNGTTTLRTGKVIKHLGDRHGLDNYGKLCYSSKYPWEAAPSEDVASMQYLLYDEKGGYRSLANRTEDCGLVESVLYRRQFFDYRTDLETHWMQAIDLADYALPEGILRADRLRLFRVPVRFTLGAFGFPDNGTEVIRRSKGAYQALILKGSDHEGRPKQLAYTIYDGFETLDLVGSTGTNPDSQRSIVAYAAGSRRKLYGAYEGSLLISQVLTRESHEDFTEEELFCIEEIRYTDSHRTGAFGPVVLHLITGQEITIDFEEIEGRF